MCNFLYLSIHPSTPDEVEPDQDHVTEIAPPAFWDSARYSLRHWRRAAANGAKVLEALLLQFVGLWLRVCHVIGGGQ